MPKLQTSHGPSPHFAASEWERASSCPVEDIAQAYLSSTQGDAGIALRCAITDALSDLMEAERRARENSRLISRGFVRSAPADR
ncbi:MAG TPA: hypothetical protein VGU70_02660 [Methylobacterium sp.]|uniref:hypothetical protein n=1 Tax=Methylorubrum sp. B1-46 TaxID=2897334 RepID=UPI001E60BB08|nr:hypothetical protein [Methylorubrum sp. B1-46]UGB24076.1 hypothetical protein LPC10_13955 [Methylorubrum sp. B1-46]HEV2541646.1 hypothetical protein [Methylobacterium sp.]